MADVRTRIDQGFGAFARLVYRNRLKALLLMGLLVGGLLSQLPKLTADNSTDVFFKPDDPALLVYDEFREQFGRDEMVIVAVTPPNVFDTAFLEKFTALHQALESEVPYLREVTSLVNVRNTRGRGEELVVEDLMKEIPRTPAEMAVFRERVLGSRLYPNFYISADGGAVAIFIETFAFSPGGATGDLLAGFEEKPKRLEKAKPLTEAENGEVVRAVEKVAARFRSPDFTIHLAGPPVMVDFFNRSIAHDVGLFMSLAFLAFTVFLLYLFRRISGALIPLLVVVLSLLSTISLMAIFEVPFSSVTSILPSFMMSVGVGSSVHTLAIFYRSFRESGNKEAAIVFTFQHSGLPIFMTGITTAAGLLSFAPVNIAPVAHLGLFGGGGVLVILVFTMVLMPALIALLPLRQVPRFEGKSHTHRIDRVLTAIAEFSISHAKSVVLVSAGVVAVAGVGLVWQGFGHNMPKWLPHDTPVRQGIDLLDREFKGGFTMEFVLDSGRENGLYEPSVMNKIGRLTEALAAYRDPRGEQLVGKTTSVLDVLQETHMALNENQPRFYAVPDNRRLIAQELLLFENSGSNDLERIVDTQFSKARVSARVLVRDATEYRDFVNYAAAAAETIFADSAQVTLTGSVKLFTQTVALLMETVARSYAIALLVITALMILMLGSFRIGLLSMIPNVAPIAVTLGIMGWLGIKLDMSNMLLGTVALGLAVDDTIHFFHNFRNYYARSGNTLEAVRHTMLSTGRAILFTTLVLVTGFWLFMFASLINLIQFGFLIGVTLIIALLGDVLLAPAMMELLGRTRHGHAVLQRWVHSDGKA